MDLSGAAYSGSHRGILVDLSIGGMPNWRDGFYSWWVEATLGVTAIFL